MSLFGKLASAVGSRKDRETEKAVTKELETLKREGRLHARHVVNGQDLLSLTLPSGAKATIRDVSYGGLGLLFPATDSPKVGRVAESTKAQLKILDRELTVTGTPVYFMDRGANDLFVGFQIKHEAPESLIALREVLEPIRWGGSLSPIGPEVRHERYQGSEWSCLRGEGPTDLVIKTSPDRTDILEGLLTFRVGSAYCDVSLREGRMSTSRSLSEGSRGPVDAGSQMVTSGGGLDAATLRYAVYILLGAPEAARKQAQPLLVRMVEALGLPKKDVA